ncbi:DNA alkylation repair protein [Caproiciproducens sp. NJN-50]|uniref:DNA alkylation repair protein n=1 Tax=Acutalibacteraceae TaxID=3082771 RepID=UPI000FFE1AA7|nr:MULTISPECIES: DNA alkylation repair protein [Acutalibacteraceae]QAT50792.1 DNA alkylation repair protein [Caproiciproducens sp. NJN-50]
MHDVKTGVQSRLFALQDLKYKNFQCKLMPTVAPERVIGVRTPELRKLAKELFKEPETAEFLKMLPHQYYDENNLHGFLVEQIGDYSAAVAAIDDFLPYVDNWATCDLMNPRVFKKHRRELLREIRRWMASDRTYTIRFGIGMLMTHFLDENFAPEHPAWAASIRSEEYYVNMMIAWYFATALAKQWDAAIPYIRQNRLEKWVHNKAIQKAVESYRITDEQKACLRTLRVK